MRMSNEFHDSLPPQGFYYYAPEPPPLEEEQNSISVEELLKGSKLLLSASAIIFVIILLKIGSHIYTIWCRRDLHRHLRSRPRPSTQFIFYMEPYATTAASSGLDPSIIESLPVFTYAPSNGTIDCAVCLSEFETNESGLRLPKCGHAFHVECIKMWFRSHSNCPLCRAVVEKSPADACPAPNESGSTLLSIGSGEIRNSKTTEVLNVSISSLDVELPSPAETFPGDGTMRSLRRIFSRATLSPTAESCVSASHDELDEMERGETPRPVSE